MESKPTRTAFPLFPRLHLLITIFLIAWSEAICATNSFAAKMVLESLTGDVTTNELNSFINFLNTLPPPPTDNVGNTMVYESVGGARLHGMQTFYSFTKDQRALDAAIAWSDAFLAARNDPATGRFVWTGRRELCWPNKPTNDIYALYSGTENGDVIEHIVNTAKLILENPSLWTNTAPPDAHHFGVTYLDRAQTYVRECQRSAETTIVRWYVHNTKSGYRLIHPDAPEYWKSCVSKGPVPWNQQQMIVGGLLRLAQCHRLLNDGNTNIAYYEKITADAADWFFSSALLFSARGHVCYDWAYDLTLDIAAEPEDTGHTFYDAYVFRAYSAHLGPTRTNLQRLINTARFVMNVDTNRFSGLVNGTSNQRRPERKYLNYEWIEMSVLDRQLYDLLGNAVLTSHQYLEDIPVEASILYAKHYWANNPAAESTYTPEDATGIPPIPSSSRRMSQSAVLLIAWGVSELFLSLFKRSKKSTAVSKDRNSLRLIWLVCTVAVWLAIIAAYKLPAWKIPSPDTVKKIGYCLFIPGIILRWYTIFYLGRFFTTNVAIAHDHRVIDTGPYRYIRHPSYAGSLVTILGLGLTLHNWASLALLFLPICAVNLWRIHIEEQALTTALGQPYQQYKLRTKRLIPLIY